MNQLLIMNFDEYKNKKWEELTSKEKSEFVEWEVKERKEKKKMNQLLKECLQLRKEYRRAEINKIIQANQWINLPSKSFIPIDNCPRCGKIIRVDKKNYWEHIKFLCKGYPHLNN